MKMMVVVVVMVVVMMMMMIMITNTLRMLLSAAYPRIEGLSAFSWTGYMLRRSKHNEN